MCSYPLAEGGLLQRESDYLHVCFGSSVLYSIILHSDLNQLYAFYILYENDD
jgi:hypothetical protein